MKNWKLKDFIVAFILIFTFFLGVIYLIIQIGYDYSKFGKELSLKSNVLLGLYGIYIGVIFILSYFLRNTNEIFKTIYDISRKYGTHKIEKMSLLTGLVAITVALLYLISILR